MIHFAVLVKGMALGFSIAAPVGPIGVLCLRRTVQFGRTSGIVSGIGAAAADAVYGAIAACGLTAISELLIGFESWLRLLGGVFLMYLGLRIFKTPPSTEASLATKSNLISDFFSTFLLTITNPLTILSFVAVFAGLGMGEITTTRSSASLLISGVFVGSVLWWVILCAGVSLFRRKINQKALRYVNRIAALTIVAFGLFALATILI